MLGCKRFLGGVSRALLDPAGFDPGGLTTLAWYEPSPDGRLMARGLFKAWDEHVI
ncbi:MAG TPA: hypothetical protein VGS07_23690 [Thermoanaerobaculia bacterium]|nr:hypothetical protein [Thermoanaerobaculia bacterium]